MAATRGTEALHAVMVSAVRPLALLVAGAVIVGLVTEAAVLAPITRRGDVDLERSARLLAGDLRRRFIGRGVASLVGGVVLPLMLILITSWARPPIGLALVVAVASLVAVFGGALMERRLFFLVVSAPRMPGVLR